MGLVFRLVEGDDEEFTNRFIEEYYNLDNSVNDILKILDISRGKYQRMRKKLLDRNIMEDVRYVPPKNYYFEKRTRKYRVVKHYNYRQVIFATFNREEGAIKAVELYNKYGWDKKNTEKILGEVAEYFDGVE